MGIIQTLLPWTKFCLILSHPPVRTQPKNERSTAGKKTRNFVYHSFWVLNMAHAHTLDLFRRQETKLDLLDGAQRRARMLENQRHGCCSFVLLPKCSRTSAKLRSIPPDLFFSPASRPLCVFFCFFLSPRCCFLPRASYCVGVVSKERSDGRGGGLSLSLPLEARPGPKDTGTTENKGETAAQRSDEVGVG